MASSASAASADALPRQPEVERSKGPGSAKGEQGGVSDPMDILRRILSALQGVASSMLNMITSAVRSMTSMMR